MLNLTIYVVLLIITAISAQTHSVINGNMIEISLRDSLNEFRNCPSYIDSCLYVCDDGTTNPCQPQNIYTIAINTNNDDDESTEGSRYRIYFPWEYEDMTADKFTITASWPCLSPTAVYASGNYVFWDIYGNAECPGTVQGSIWYGENCEDDYGNIGSNECHELVGRFCFAPGDTLNWDESADQSISSDICDDCWMSSPAWSYYSSELYSDSLLYPEFCEFYDHCHHSFSDSTLCGVGFMDDTDTSSITIFEEKEIIKKYTLGNFPNPFNSSTRIYYQIPSNEHVNINIISINGNHIKTLVNNIHNNGKYTVHWDGRDENGVVVPAGVYIYKLKIKNLIQSNKMIFLK